MKERCIKVPEECDKNECNYCDCQGCKDYACSLWTCLGVCEKEGKQRVVNCQYRAENNPDWREGDDEDWK